MSVLVPVLRDKYLKAWPGHAVGPRVQYVPLDRALTEQYPTDAHFAAYSVPSMERRLDRSALTVAGPHERIPGGVAMALAVFDVDDANAHREDRESAPAWWEAQQERIARLLARHPGGFVYRTRGGYHVVFVLGDPVVLRDTSDGEAWTRLYLSWVAYLRDQFDIEADTACANWGRVYRLPHATRGSR